MPELTPEELAELALLENPDEPEPVKFDYEKALQKEIIGMMLRDRIFLEQCMSIIKPHYFVETIHTELCRILFNYFEVYRQIPDEKHIIQEIRERILDKTKHLAYVGELRACIRSYIPGAQTRSYLIDKITGFAKDQAIKNAISQTIDVIKSRRLSQNDKETVIANYWRDALTLSPNIEIGLDYFAEFENTITEALQQDDEKDRFTCGFDEIDELIQGKGLKRGEIGAYMGMSGAGKSLALAQAAVKNIWRGKKVLYISTEMDEKRLAQRFTTYFSGWPMQGLQESQVSHVISTIHDTLEQIMREVAHEDIDRRRLFVKQFPAGTADINTLRAYASQLNLRGFRPDLVIVDYVGELKDYPDMKVYESRQRLVRDLRAWGVEEKYCMLTAMQPNRAGREAQKDGGHIDDSEIGDSYGQIRPLDACWSLNQDENEQGASVGRVFVVKHRNGQSRVNKYFARNRRTLMMNVISHEQWIMEKSKAKKTAGNAVEIDTFNIPDASTFKTNGGADDEE